MSAPELGRQRDATATGNELAPLVLGLMRLLDRVAAASASTTAVGPARPSTSDHDDQVLAALLGALSLRRTLQRWLDAAGLEPEPSDRRAPALRPQQGSWLR